MVSEKEITAEQMLEKFKKDPNSQFTEEEIKNISRDEYRRFLDLWFQTTEGRKQIIDWVMEWW